MLQSTPFFEGAAAALRHQRENVKRVGLRYVAEQSRALAERDPTHFSYVSHGTLSRIERSQGSWFQTNVNIGVIESLVHILWGGDHSAFIRDTGLHLPLPLYQPDPHADATPTVQLPYYLQGEDPGLYQRHRRLHQVPDRRADFLYQHEANDMQPVVGPHHLLNCRRANHVPTGQLAVLQRTTGLTLAWNAGNDTYLTEANPDPFQLSADEQVYGIVIALQPYRSNLAASPPSDPRDQEARPGNHQDLASLLARNIPRERGPRKSLTVSCPLPLQNDLREQAQHLRLPLRSYLETAIESLLERYETNPRQLPSPLPRPQNKDPNLNTHVRTNLFTRLSELTTRVQQLEGRADTPTKAAIILLAFRQLLAATRTLEPPHLPRP